MQETWLVMCPDWQSVNHINKAHGWALFSKAIENIGNDYFSPKINCIVCGKKFSLQQGVSEAFSSDIVIDNFRYNSHESGKIEVTVGQLSRIGFTEPFLDAPVINLTPYLKPVDAVSGYITSEGFAIFTCANVCSVEEKRQITWSASGNRASTPVPLWRMLLSNAKEHQLRKNFRAEIVELESAVELFISEYLSKNLGTKLRRETIEWLLRQLSIERQMEIGFMELTGQSLEKLHPTEYHKWKKHVKETRNHIVHRGSQVTFEQANKARKAAFDLIAKTDSGAMEHFQIQMKNIGLDGPHMTFGSAKGTGAQQTIPHGLAGTPHEIMLTDHNTDLNKSP